MLLEHLLWASPPPQIPCSRGAVLRTSWAPVDAVAPGQLEVTGRSPFLAGGSMAVWEEGRHPEQTAHPNCSDTLTGA